MSRYDELRADLIDILHRHLDVERVMRYLGPLQQDLMRGGMEPSIIITEIHRSVIKKMTFGNLLNI